MKTPTSPPLPPPAGFVAPPVYGEAPPSYYQATGVPGAPPIYHMPPPPPVGSVHATTTSFPPPAGAVPAPPPAVTTVIVSSRPLCPQCHVGHLYQENNAAACLIVAILALLFFPIGLLYFLCLPSSLINRCDNCGYQC